MKRREEREKAESPEERERSDFLLKLKNAYRVKIFCCNDRLMSNKPTHYTYLQAGPGLNLVSLL